VGKIESCMCVCVRESEIVKEWEGKYASKKSEREREKVCVCERGRKRVRVSLGIIYEEKSECFCALLDQKKILSSQ